MEKEFLQCPRVIGKPSCQRRGTLHPAKATPTNRQAKTETLVEFTEVIDTSEVITGMTKIFILSLNCSSSIDILFDDFHHLAQFLRGTEFDILRTCFHHPEMSRRHIVDVACLIDFLVILEREAQTALDDVAPVRALTAIIWQAFERRGRVDRLIDLTEFDSVAAPFDLPEFAFRQFDRDG